MAPTKYTAEYHEHKNGISSHLHWQLDRVQQYKKWKEWFRVQVPEAFQEVVCVQLSERCPLIYWGRVTHICVSKLTTTGSDNGLSPGRRQAIIWTNAGILSVGLLGWNFSELLIEIQNFSFICVICEMAAILSRGDELNQTRAESHAPRSCRRCNKKNMINSIKSRLNIFQ